MNTMINDSFDIKFEGNRSMNIPFQIDHYKVNLVILEQNYSVVLEAVDQENNRTVAIKCVTQEYYQNNSVGEIDILKSINHPNIIHLIDFFQYPKENPRFVVFVMPRAHYDLYESILQSGFFAEKKVRRIMNESLNAIDYLHSRNIWHRNIKPENILLMDEERDTVVIAGFRYVISTAEQTINGQGTGTIIYSAPELLEDNSGVLQFKSDATYSNKIDSWSLGVVMYLMLYGTFPFDETTRDGVENLLRGQFSFPEDSSNDVSEDAKDLIRNLLCADVDRRITVHDALNHRFFTNNGEQ